MTKLVRKSQSIQSIVEERFPDIIRNAKEFNFNSEKKEAQIITEDNDHRYVHKIKVYKNVVMQNNIKVNIPNKKRNYAKDIIAMKDEGYTQEEIASILGISQSYVSKILKQYI